jgi:hypothetical protein
VHPDILPRPTSYSADTGEQPRCRFEPNPFAKHILEGTLLQLTGRKETRNCTSSPNTPRNADYDISILTTQYASVYLATAGADEIRESVRTYGNRAFLVSKSTAVITAKECKSTVAHVANTLPSPGNEKMNYAMTASCCLANTSHSSSNKVAKRNTLICCGFWDITRRVIFVGRRIGTPCLFRLLALGDPRECQFTFITGKELRNVGTLGVGNISKFKIR